MMKNGHEKPIQWATTTSVSGGKRYDLVMFLDKPNATRMAQNEEILEASAQVENAMLVAQCGHATATKRYLDWC